MKKISIILFLLALMAVTGCIAVQTFNRRDIKTRGKIRFEDISFMKSGETKLEEILLAIGEPDYMSDTKKILIYIWSVRVNVIIPVTRGGSVRKFTHENIIICLDKQNRFKEWVYQGSYNPIDYELLEKILAGDEEYKKQNNLIRSSDECIKELKKKK